MNITRFLLMLFVGAMIALPISKVCAVADTILRKIEAVETDSPPEIDGKLEDSCWQKAAQTGDFIQFEPNTGEPASQKTKFTCFTIRIGFMSVLSVSKMI